MQGFRLKVADTRKEHSKRGFYDAHGVRQGSRNFEERDVMEYRGDRLHRPWCAYAILDISEITDAEIFKQLLP